MPPEDTIVVRFVKAYTVNNGTGVPAGPSYRVGQVERFSTVSGDFWIRTGNAVRVSEEEAAKHESKPATGDGSDELDSLKARELVDLAANEKIELGKAQTKAEMIAAIREARTARTKPTE